jgi:pimeloyl-ACP methyl ester carboxylesterase
MEKFLKKLLFFILIFISINTNHSYLNGLTLKTKTNEQKKRYLLDSNYFCELNKNLKSNDPDCFNSRFIKDSEKASLKLEELGGQYAQILDERSENIIHCTFFDRASDTLLVLGVGFPVQRQRMLPFVKLFPKYDLILFDYRGIGSNHDIIKWDLLFPWKWKGLLSWLIAKVDFNISGLGTLEEDEVIAVVKACKSKKNYKNVFGLGLCFSSYVFAKAAEEEPTLFDKLIFDGSWPSLELVIRRIIKDPSLICSVENPHSLFPCLTHRTCTQSLGIKLLEYILWLNLYTFPLSHYLSKLTSPMLFIQSVEDCYCNKEEFKELWREVKTSKAVLFTENLHGRNHVWDAEVYKEVSENFFDFDFDDFLKWIESDPSILLKSYECI